MLTTLIGKFGKGEQENYVKLFDAQYKNDSENQAALQKMEGFIDLKLPTLQIPERIIVENNSMIAYAKKRDLYFYPSGKVRDHNKKYVTDEPEAFAKSALEMVAGIYYTLFVLQRNNVIFPPREIDHYIAYTKDSKGIFHPYFIDLHKAQAKFDITTTGGTTTVIATGIADRGSQTSRHNDTYRVMELVANILFMAVSTGKTGLPLSLNTALVNYSNELTLQTKKFYNKKEEFPREELTNIEIEYTKFTKIISNQKNVVHYLSELDKIIKGPENSLYSLTEADFGTVPPCDLLDHAVQLYYGVFGLTHDNIQRAVNILHFLSGGKDQYATANTATSTEPVSSTVGSPVSTVETNTSEESTKSISSSTDFIAKALYHYARIRAMYYHEYEREILLLDKIDENNIDNGSGRILDPYASLAVAYANKIRREKNQDEYENYKTKEKMYANIARLGDPQDQLFQVLSQCKPYERLEF